MRRLGTNLLVAVTSLAVFLGAAELLARLAYDPGANAAKGIFEYDPEKVFALKRSAEGRFMGRRVTTNARGHRDGEIATPKAAGVLRVVVLGDSVSFGHGVDGDEAWPQRLEELLRRRFPEDAFEVVNAAVPGNGPLQEYHDARRALVLEPDLFLLQFSLNDVTEPYRFLRRLGGTGWDYHRVRDAPYLHWLLSRHSALYLFMRDVFARVRFLNASGRGIRADAERRETYGVTNLILHPDEPALREAWRECLGWMQQIADLAAGAGVPLVLVASPFELQLELAPSRAHPQQELRRFALTHAIPFVDLLADLQQRLGREAAAAALWGEYFLDGGHPNAQGHGWIAETLLPVVAGELGVAAPAQLQAR